MAKRPTACRRQLDPCLWKACAGTAASVPAAGASVYYFPDGHSEQTVTPADLSAVCRRKPFLFLCSVISVDLLADSATDEVYAVIRLLPVAPGAAVAGPEEESPPPAVGPGMRCHVKTLTASDANNGGGFSMPRLCADELLPVLRKTGEKPPFQTVPFTDVHGRVWEFRHIFRGTPPRNLLTTGWSKFVSSKRLVAGDCVVFARNAEGELFVGIRRARSRGGKLRDWCGAGNAVSAEGEAALSRRLAAGQVVDAVRAAEKRRAFEVAYHPRPGAAAFVVGRATVERTAGFPWKAGMRVRTEVEVAVKGQGRWRLGTVVRVKGPDQCPRSWSPWRMLQVNWDEPEILSPTINPWEVELVQEIPGIPHPFVLNPSGSTLEMREMGSIMPFPVPAIHSPVLGGSSIHSSDLCDSSPAGMQGARQDAAEFSGLSSFTPYHIEYVNTFENVENVLSLAVGHMSAESSTRGLSSSEILLLPNVNTAPSSTHAHSFRLFGKNIQLERLSDPGASSCGAERWNPA